MTGSSAVQVATQTLVFPPTLTNFGTQGIPPVSPNAPLQLFNPTLGTLVAVKIDSLVTFSNDVTTTNTSRSSVAEKLTAFEDGTSKLGGLAPVELPGTPTITESPNGGRLGLGRAESFTVSVSDSKSVTLTQPPDLAAFIASPGHTSITPTLSATNHLDISATDGNLSTIVRTATAGGIVVVTYSFICPTPTSVVRFGIHHQQTQLVVTFSGPVDPAQAQDVNNYKVIAPGPDRKFGTPDDVQIPIRSAVYNPSNNSVTLTPAVRLNAHFHFELLVNLPCQMSPVILPFGGKPSLGGFFDHSGQFIAFVNGHFVREG
jgi:hypothetical protein